MLSVFLKFILISKMSIFRNKSRWEISSWAFLYIFFTIKMKLDIAIDKYLKYREYVQKVEYNTLLKDRGALYRFHEYMFTKKSYVVDLDEIVVDDIIEYCEFLWKTEFRFWRKNWLKSTLAHNTQVVHQLAIRRFFKHCFLFKETENNLYLMPVAKIKKKAVPSLTHDEVQKFFEIAKQNKVHILAVRDELMLRLAYFTGLRKNEIVSLTFDQILWDSQFQIIWKLCRTRTVYFDEDSKIKQLALELKYLYMKENLKDVWADYVFRSIAKNCKGELLWRTSLYWMIKEYWKKLWIKKKITLHSFRHTFATTLLERGVDIRQVQILLGHQNISSTQVYTHISENKLKECCSLLHL